MQTLGYGSDEAEGGDPTIGSIIAGKYRVEKVLGQGGMGVVYRATHTLLDEPIALKLLHPDIARKPDAQRRFLQEARAALRLSGEHVARVVDVGTTEGEPPAPYIAFEYLEGIDLADLVDRDGPLAIEKAAFYTLQACVGIAEAHAQGIVHRDLKPSNVFVARTREGGERVKVLDFGISKVLDDEKATALTRSSATLGSPMYMAPEQIRGARDVDERADVWGLGATLFELLAGITPFDGETVTAMLAAIAADPPRPIATYRPEIDPRLAAAVLRCLEKDRRARFASVGELADALVPHGGAEGAHLAERVHAILRGSTRRIAVARTEPASADPEQPAQTVEVPPSAPLPAVPPVDALALAEGPAPSSAASPSRSAASSTASGQALGSTRRAVVVAAVGLAAIGLTAALVRRSAPDTSSVGREPTASPAVSTSAPADRAPEADAAAASPPASAPPPPAASSTPSAAPIAAPAVAAASTRKTAGAKVSSPNKPAPSGAAGGDFGTLFKDRR